MIGLKEAFQTRSPDNALLALTEKVFRRKGLLVEALRLEHRPQQEEMAHAVAQAFASDRTLLFEASTGVGKSLAYLIPALLHAEISRRQCVVSTHTISLQEQLQRNDLPLARTMFESDVDLHPFRGFCTALLVGRGNYVCGTRLARAMATRRELFPGMLEFELNRVADWITGTRQGLLQEIFPRLHPEVWDWVSADSSACNRRNCQPDTCFFQKARSRLRKAHVIIVNHSLLFSLINAGAAPGSQHPGVLFANDFLVLDEAHRLPGVAVEQFGSRVTSVGLARLLRQLYNPKTQRGILRLHGNTADRRAASEAITQGEVFFSHISRQVLAQRDLVRLYEAGWCPATLNPYLSDLAKRLAEAADRLEDGPDRETMIDLRNRVNGYNNAVNHCLGMTEPDHVYWAERSGRKRTNIGLRATPIDVAPVLREALFDRKTSVLLTSATLAEGTDMSNFMARTGTHGELAEQVSSPFNYERQVVIYIASDAPAPDRHNQGLNIEFLTDTVAFCALRVEGGSLVLFTSHSDMRRVAAGVEPVIIKAGRSFFLHGRDGPRSELAEAFHRAGNGVLFGTDSFWTGVDIPGRSLSQVMVTRLPFENPSHPIAEARAEWIRSRGGNPFGEMTLPDAVLKLRQGIGRLIRKQSDFGTITILDSRLVNREYGLRFLSILPRMHHVRFDRTNRNILFRPKTGESSR